MIEVVITGQQVLAEMDKYDWSVGSPVHVRVACTMRAILHSAGIPLGLSFDPTCDPIVRSGRLEWYEDRLTDTKVFRWYPPEETVTECPL